MNKDNKEEISNSEREEITAYIKKLVNSTLNNSKDNKNNEVIDLLLTPESVIDTIEEITENNTEVIINSAELKAATSRLINSLRNIAVDILPAEENVIDTFEVLSVKKVEHLRNELEYMITASNLQVNVDSHWQDKLTGEVSVEWNGSKCIPLEVGDDQLTLVGLLSN